MKGGEGRGGRAGWRLTGCAAHGGMLRQRLEAARADGRGTTWPPRGAEQPQAGGGEAPRGRSSAGAARKVEDAIGRSSL